MVAGSHKSDWEKISNYISCEVIGKGFGLQNTDFRKFETWLENQTPDSCTIIIKMPTEFIGESLDGLYQALEKNLKPLERAFGINKIQFFSTGRTIKKIKEDLNINFQIKIYKPEMPAMIRKIQNFNPDGFRESEHIFAFKRI